MYIPLSIKISIVVIVAIMLQTGVLLFNAYNDLVVESRKQVRDDVHLNMSRLQQTLEFLWEKEEFEQIQSELTYMGPGHYVNKILLVDESNKVVASSRISNIDNNMEMLINQNENYQKNLLDIFDQTRKIKKPVISVNNQKTELYAVFPVDMGLIQGGGLRGRKIGVVYSVIDLDWISVYVQDALQKKVIPMLLLLGVTGLFFVVALNRYFVKRIINVNQAASDFTSSGYKSRALVKGNDEISELAEAFNSMADTVASKNNELIKKEEDISEILNFMENGVVCIDEAGIVKSFNYSAEKMFGYSSNEIIGENVKKLMPEPYQSEHDGYLHSYIQTGKEKIIGIGRDVLALHKDGTEFTMHLSVAEMPEVAGRDRLFIGSCLDVSMQKEQESQLRHSQKMDALGKLTGGIAHDYNNMLGVILGYAELIKDEMADNNPRILKFVNEIYHAGNRGAKLTRKLLSFSRQKSAEPEIVNINEILNDNRHMLEKTLTVRIHIEFELENDLWPVFIDSNDLEDSVLNMCINAMHAMDGTGEISLGTYNVHLNNKEANLLELELGAGDYVCLKVCDTGCGMSEDVLNKVFDPFFSTKAEKGNGLGLSQVYGFVKRSNGSVNVESKSGQGSCFSLYFPRYMSEVSYQQASDYNRSIRTGSETILIVDDEPALNELLEEILISHGYKVYSAANGEQALKVLQNINIDLVISDVLMPGMDGYQLAEKIKDKYPVIKLQLVSGFSDDLHMKRRDHELHENLLHKPFDRQQLLCRVRDLLDGVLKAEI